MKTTLLLFLCATLGYSQTITNVVAKQEGTNVIVIYDLNGSPNTDYFVKLLYSKDSGYTFSNELVRVSGDVKGGVKAGLDKKIIWDAEREVNYLNDQIIFKVVAEAKKHGAQPVTVNNITAEVLSAKREGSEIRIEFTITQNFQEYESIRTKIMCNSKVFLFDGTSVTPTEIRLSSATGCNQSDYFFVDNTDSDKIVECPKGIPVKGTLIIKSYYGSSSLVLSSLHIKLSIRWDNGTGGGQLNDLIIKNIPIQ